MKTKRQPVKNQERRKEAIAPSAVNTENSEKIPALGHKGVIDKAIEATCEATGKTEGSHCKICDKILKSPEGNSGTGTQKKRKW